MPVLFVALALLAVATCGASCRPEKARTPSPGEMTSPESRDRPAGLTITEVLDRHSAALMAIPGVTAVGEGALDSGAPCIRIYVERLDEAMRSRLPLTLEGFDVVVEESGPIRAQDDTTGKEPAP